jgi:hypothetical protein
VFVVAGVAWFFWPSPAPPQTDPFSPEAPFPYTVIMPEDLERLEAEVWEVCKQYAGLDLSGMVKICKRVGYQE